MDALALLETRRSVSAHLLAAPGPSEEEIARLIAIASRVPDHGKLTPWRFVIFEGEARERAGAIIERAFLKREPEADAARRAQERGRLSRAPLVIAVVSAAAEHPKIPVWEQTLSAGAVCMNLVIAAHALGYAANWLTDWFAYDRDVLAAFGLKPHEAIAGFIHIGAPRERLPDRPRPAFADIATRFGA